MPHSAGPNFRLTVLVPGHIHGLGQSGQCQEAILRSAVFRPFVSSMLCGRWGMAAVRTRAGQAPRSTQKDRAAGRCAICTGSPPELPLGLGEGGGDRPYSATLLVVLDICCSTGAPEGDGGCLSMR